MFPALSQALGSAFTMHMETPLSFGFQLLEWDRRRVLAPQQCLELKAFTMFSKAFRPVTLRRLSELILRQQSRLSPLVSLACSRSPQPVRQPSRLRAQERAFNWQAFRLMA